MIFCNAYFWLTSQQKENTRDPFIFMYWRSKCSKFVLLKWLCCFSVLVLHSLWLAWLLILHLLLSTTRPCQSSATAAKNTYGTKNDGNGEERERENSTRQVSAHLCQLLPFLCPAACSAGNLHVLCPLTEHLPLPCQWSHQGFADTWWCFLWCSIRAFSRICLHPAK